MLRDLQGRRVFQQLALDDASRLASLHDSLLLSQRQSLAERVCLRPVQPHTMLFSLIHRFIDRVGVGVFLSCFAGCGITQRRSASVEGHPAG